MRKKNFDFKSKLHKLEENKDKKKAKRESSNTNDMEAMELLQA